VWSNRNNSDAGRFVIPGSSETYAVLCNSVNKVKARDPRKESLGAVKNDQRLGVFIEISHWTFYDFCCLVCIRLHT